MEVREATKSDLQWIVGELKVFANDYISDNEIFGGDEYILNLLNSLIENHLVLVADEDGELKGFVCGSLAPHLYNPKLVELRELAWWVPKKYRGQGIGSKLLDAYTVWGMNNANWTVFSLTRNTEFSEEQMLNRGYKKMETNYFIERM